MDYRHLRFFLAVAEELHFTRAARRLHVAQPHLSQEIRRLEGELGVELFARTRRRVALTPAGETFALGARRVLAATDEAVRAARRAAAGDTGRLSIGFVGSAGYDVFPEAIRRYRAGRPDVELELHELTTAEQIPALRAGRIDVGVLRPLLASDPGLEFATLLDEPLVVALPEGHRLSGMERVALAELAGEPWIVFPRHVGPGLYSRTMRACERAGFTPRVVQEVGQLPTMVNLVASGLGVALVPASVGSLVRAGAVYREVAPPVPTSPLMVAWRQDDPSATLRAFLETIRAVAGDGAPPPAGP